MSDLQAQREEQKILEKKQVDLMLKIINEQRSRFEFAEVSHHLAFEKNVEDLTVLNDALTEWILKLKPEDKRKKELTNLLQSVWRVMTYCQSLETITKTAVSKYVGLEKRNTQLASERRTLELQIEQLRKEKDAEIESLTNALNFQNENQ